MWISWKSNSLRGRYKAMKMSIHISDLEKFIGDTLSGEWLHLPVPEKVLIREIGDVCSNINTYVITEYDGPLNIEQFESVFELNRFLHRLGRLTEQNQKKVCFLINVIGCSPEEAMEQYRVVTYYPDLTLKGIALGMLKESDIISQPSSPKKYIDVEKIMHDLMRDGFYETESGVFWYF